MSFKVKEAIKKINDTEVLFFDLDGTLIDTEHLYFRFWKEASKYYGYELKDEEALNFRSRERQSAREYMRHISDGILDYDIVRDKRIELMNEYFKDHPIQMKPGAIELLKKYKNEGKRIYIVTANNVEKSEGIIRPLGFYDLLDGIISAKDVKRGKPFPDVFLKACEIVNVKPQDVVVFEDSPNGLMASHAAECYTLMVEDLTPYTKDMTYVDSVVSSLEELL